jgi:polyisoprenyl-phosphate glycosyltransferase
MATYSFVIPVLNEEAVLPELYRRLVSIGGSLDGECEFVFVDDGSTDSTPGLLSGLHQRDGRVKVIRLSRNFGHQMAIRAGLDFARGDAVITMDADLQDPPELVPEMVERWREGYEVVHAQRHHRSGESRVRLGIIHVAYRLLRWSSETDLRLDTGDYRLIDARVAEIVRNMPEPNPYVRGMVAWAGFRQTSVTYDRDPRFAGEAKYTYARLVRLALDGLLGFSTVPLRVAMVLGFVISFLAFGAGITAVGLKLGGVFTPPGWASLTVIVSFLAGIQLLVMGAIGLYVGRIYDQGKHRPLYLVAETHGLAVSRDPTHAARSLGPV